MHVNYVAIRWPTVTGHCLLTTCLPMFTGCSIQAGVSHHQALDGSPTDDVGFDDFIDVGFGDESVPDRIGIDHEVRAVLALVEAASLIGPHSVLESALGELLLEEFLQLGLAAGIAASPRISRRPLVAAYENMSLKFRHEPILPETKAQFAQGAEQGL
jgi:hypothetical protein